MDEEQTEAESLAQHEVWLRERTPNDLGPEGMGWGWWEVDHNDGRGTVRDIWWRHRCMMPNGTTPIVLGYLDVTTGERHEVITEDPLTVHGGSGSVLCRSCGTHGFIREGAWVPA